MKNLSLVMLVACSLNISVASVSGHNDPGNRTMAFTLPWSDRLDAEVNHLNRMRGHVRWHLNYYRARATGQIRRDFARISREIDQVNSDFRQRSHDRRHLHREIERLHAALHDIERRLHVRAADYYHWR